MVNRKLFDQVMRYYKFDKSNAWLMRFDLACQPECIIMLLDSSLRLVEVVNIELAV
jgi:hypothetical protein